MSPCILGLKRLILRAFWRYVGHGEHALHPHHKSEPSHHHLAQRVVWHVIWRSTYAIKGHKVTILTTARALKKQIAPKI